MTDEQTDHGTDPGPGRAGSVGSVGEEAAKLLDALQGWASSATGSGIDEHLATGGQDCAYCPVCQVISRVRSAGPEVRTQLAVGASSLLHAAAALLDARAAAGSSSDSSGSSPAGGGPHVTKIDLDDEGPVAGQGG